MDKGYKQLTLKERKEIEDGLNRGDSLRAIARLIGRSPSTVSREVRENRHVRAFRPRRGACRDRVLPPMHFPPIDVFNLNTSMGTCRPPQSATLIARPRHGGRPQPPVLPAVAVPRLALGLRPLAARRLPGPVLGDDEQALGQDGEGRLRAGSGNAQPENAPVPGLLR